MSGLVFDDTALVALFDAHPYVTQLWRHAGHELVDVLVPATAILAANRRLEETDEAWSLVLDGDNMLVLDLTMTRALAASRLGADLVTAHVSVEAARRRRHGRHRASAGLPAGPTDRGVPDVLMRRPGRCDDLAVGSAGARPGKADPLAVARVNGGIRAG